MLDFWGRRRWPRNRGNAPVPWARSHRFRGPRRRAQKSSTGYPVPDCSARRRGRETAGTQRFSGQACTGIEAPRGGPKSQAPDIRCLTFGTAAGDAKRRPGSPGIAIGIGIGTGIGIGVEIGIGRRWPPLANLTKVAYISNLLFIALERIPPGRLHIKYKCLG